MEEALDFWNLSYQNGWFARLSVVDKAISNVIGTIELCLRVSEDSFDHAGILRIDVRSDYEKEDVLYDIVTLISPHFSEMLGCSEVLTKGPIYAVERIRALERAGFSKSARLLVCENGCTYDGYWTTKLL